MKMDNPIIRLLDSSLFSLPSPSSLSYMWNFGSLIGMCLSVQVLSGMLLAMHYSCDTSLAFESVSHVMRDVNWGWMMRIVHANGASFFFFFLYLHIGRGLYYGSYNLHIVWMSGVTLLLMVMATAFLGYVLPWGQMSFWGATVITNLFSAIPLIGDGVVMWLWGGFSVGNATLTRFFALHFFVPFIVMFFSAVHLAFLHETGSSNPLGLNGNLDKVPFHPYFSTKDLLGMVLFSLVGLGLCFQAPWVLGDPENFIPANPLVTPVHIQPEWYFLFAYAILRSIPNKLGGVVALLSSVLVLYIMPFYGRKSFKSLSFYPLSKIGFWAQVNIFILLTWIGARPVEAPYVLTGQVLTGFYFLYFILINQLASVEDKFVFL